jgi:hypothetical protein
MGWLRSGVVDIVGAMGEVASSLPTLEITTAT